MWRKVSEFERAVRHLEWGTPAGLCGTSGIPGDCERVEGPWFSVWDSVSDGDESGTVRGAIGGIRRCGRVWLCAVCARRAQYRRAAKMQAATDWAASKGYEVSTGLISWAHAAGDALAPQLDRIARVHQSLWTGGKRRSLAARGMRWMSAATEVTFGVSGWHPHQHVLFAHEPGQRDNVWWSYVTEWHARAGTVWTDAANNCEEIRGDVCEYLGKGSLVEWSGGGLAKLADARSVPDIALAAYSGDVGAVVLWREYVKATYRRRAFFERGLRGCVLHSEPVNEAVVMACVDSRALGRAVRAGDEDEQRALFLESVGWHERYISGREDSGGAEDLPLPPFYAGTPA